MDRWIPNDEAPGYYDAVVGATISGFGVTAYDVAIGTWDETGVMLVNRSTRIETRLAGSTELIFIRDTQTLASNHQIGILLIVDFDLPSAK